MPKKSRGPATTSWTGEVSSSRREMGTIDEDMEAASNNEHNGHSLPYPEEMQTQRKTGFVCWFWVILCLALVSGTAAGLVFGLQSGIDDNDEIQNAGSARDSASDQKRRIRLKRYLVNNGVNADEEFNDPSSPQSLALDFLAFKDEQRPSAPLRDLRSKEGYGLITRYIMTLFFYQMDGPNWNFDLMFLSDFDTCYWYSIFKPPIGQLGVICNENTNEITGFSFIGDNLVGKLPKELAHLTTLSYIESIGNQVQGSIPDDFQKLTNLRTLVFAFNTISGSIPTWIDKLGRLEFLYLSNNLFTGSIPIELERLNNLKVLALNDNALDGPIDSIWTLPKMEYLFMEGNQFTGQLPQSLSTIHPQLINMDFSSNELSGMLPADIYELPSLEILDLHGNNFTGPLPKVPITSSSNLDFVALYKNQLTGQIPPSMSNLRSLRHLDLSSNKLTGQIPELGALLDIQYFFLAENDFLPGDIPDYLFTFRDLKELSLKRTQRSGTISSLLGSLDNLVVLDLDNNQLTGEIPKQIGSMTDLQFLLLNRNELNSTVPIEMGSLPNLRMALLNTNNVTGSLAPICQIPTIEVAVSDCLETSCECCATCCSENENCHDYGEVAQYDPSWETNYQRTFFGFSKFEQFSVPENTGKNNN